MKFDSVQQRETLEFAERKQANSLTAAVDGLTAVPLAGGSSVPCAAAGRSITTFPPGTDLGILIAVAHPWVTSCWGRKSGVALDPSRVLGEKLKRGKMCLDPDRVQLILSFQRHQEKMA